MYRSVFAALRKSVSPCPLSETLLRNFLWTKHSRFWVSLSLHKSQTIANLIASELSNGKRILFVTDKYYYNNFIHIAIDATLEIALSLGLAVPLTLLHFKCKQ